MKSILKFLIIGLIIMSSNSCNSKNNQLVDSSNSQFYVGTYTNNESDGIYKYSLSKNGVISGGKLVAESENPSYISLTEDKKYLIAVNEINSFEGNGTVESFLVEEDTLNFINRKSSGGAHPCFVSINSNGYVLASNYSGGNVGLLKVDDLGNLSDLLFVSQHKGSGTTNRQKSPHAHSARFFNNNTVLSADLGANSLWISKLNDVENELIHLSELKFNSAAGPRHIEFHPNEKWVYIINELDNTISLVSASENKFELVDSFSTLPEDYEGNSFCADIHMSKDGRFLYASNRGHNSIAIFEIDNSNGNLISIGHEDVKGDWPRNFALSPNENYLIVANQKSNNIVSFQRDSQSGKLTFINQIQSFSPVCIVFE